LDHPGREDGDFQYNTLINSCDSSKTEYPFHVFSNGWPDASLRTEADRAINKSIRLHDLAQIAASDREVWGCSVTSTYIVKRLHTSSNRKKRSYVPRYLEASVPWSELFVPIHRSHVGDVASTHELLTSIRLRLEAHSRMATDKGAVAQYRDTPAQLLDVFVDREKSLHRDLPDYIHAAMNPPAAQDLVWSQRFSEQVPRMAIVANLGPEPLWVHLERTS
jgi:hypothetical protein